VLLLTLISFCLNDQTSSTDLESAEDPGSGDGQWIDSEEYDISSLQLSMEALSPRRSMEKLSPRQSMEKLSPRQSKERQSPKLSVQVQNNIKDDDDDSEIYFDAS
jgi:hypothetical protein